MRILKRAKGHSGEVVRWNEPEANVREEVNRRTARAGYTTRYGEPTRASKACAAVAFGETKLNVWPRDKNGNLIE